MKAIEDFPRVLQRVPPSTHGIAAVVHQTLSADDVSKVAACSMIPVEEGESVALTIGGRCFMSDIGHERSSCLELAFNARGRVLIAGLGLGMVLPPLLEDEDVESVTIVEKMADVIALISPHYTHPKLTVLHGDIFKWRPGAGETFDVIYFDIWPLLTPMNLVQMTYLHRAFAPHLAPGGWMASWQRQYLDDYTSEVARATEGPYATLRNMLDRLADWPLERVRDVATAEPVLRSCGTAEIARAEGAA